MNDETLYLTLTDPEQAKRLIGEKNCRKCGALKPLSEFPRNKGFADGRHTQCLSCNRERALAWAAANRERSREKAREWHSNNPERSRANVAAWQAANAEHKRAAEAAWKRRNAEKIRLQNAQRRALKRAAKGQLSPNIIQILLIKQRGRCPCCGKLLGRKFHLDHITSLIEGGAHEDANMQLLRARCNLQKNRKDPLRFMQERGFLL